MYWVKPSTLTKVLRNPFNPQELMKQNKASQIFKKVKEDYKKTFPDSFNSRSIPLNFFIENYCGKTGEDTEEMTRRFIEFFESNEKQKGEAK